jgi:hypothetical protein
MRTKPGILHTGVQLISRNRQELWVILALVILTITISTPVFHQQVKVMQNDYSAHIQWTQALLNRNFEEIPLALYAHPLYQISLVSLQFLTFGKIGLFGLATILQVVLQIVMVLIIYVWLGDPLSRKGDFSRAVLAVSLLLVAPIMLLVFWDKLWYLGYIGLENFHNPTIMLLRPFAFASFICALRIFSSKHSSWKFVLLSAVLMVLSVLIKPNYALCIFPAIGLLTIITLARKRPIDWQLLIFGFFLPGVVVLFGQWLMTYSTNSGAGDKIVFDFLGVMKGYSSYLLPKLFLSISFPLIVFLLNFRKAIQDNNLLLAWFGLLAGLVQMYCLAERGDRYSDGNFLWGAQVMLFIVFVATTRFLWHEKIKTGVSFQSKNIFAYFFYGVHLVAGVAYYLFAIIVTTKSPF